MTLRHVKWLVWLVGSLLTLSGLYVNNDDGVEKSNEKRETTTVNVAPTLRPRGTVYIPDHVDETESWSQIQYLLNLQTQCRYTDVTDKPGYQHWPRPSYYFSAEADVKYCALTQTKLRFWNHFFKVLKRSVKGKSGKKSNQNSTQFGDELGKDSKMILMVRNPYSRLLNGYIEKFLLGSNICMDTSFQMFLDSVITGIKLRINLGLVFMPIYSLCLPCDNVITSVITYENFDGDLQYTITSLGIQSRFAKQILNTSKFLHTEESLHYLTTLAIKSYKIHGCTNITNLAVRLIEAFRLKGFTSGSKVMRQMLQLIETNVGVNEMASNVERLVNKKLVRRYSDDTAGKSALSDAFRDISLETMRYILDIYAFEFDAFKYDRVP